MTESKVKKAFVLLDLSLALGQELPPETEASKDARCSLENEGQVAPRCELV